MLFVWNKANSHLLILSFYSHFKLLHLRLKTNLLWTFCQTIPYQIPFTSGFGNWITGHDMAMAQNKDNIACYVQAMFEDNFFSQWRWKLSYCYVNNGWKIPSMQRHFFQFTLYGLRRDLCSSRIEVKEEDACSLKGMIIFHLSNWVSSCSIRYVVIYLSVIIIS